MTLLLFGTAIFSGAFLLFQVQLVVTKYILPWFGGSPAVWTTAMLFFQAMLLAGYAYAHLSVRHLSRRGQAALHVALLVAAASALPITPAESWKPDGVTGPVVRILGLLLVTVGLPFLALAATSPLLQEWFSGLRPRFSPYRLYALSNTGSLLALLSYPLVVEPALTRTAQADLWAWGFQGFALCSGVCAVLAVRARAPDDDVAPVGGVRAGAPGRAQRVLWLALPAVASVLFLAVTNQISQDVAVVPFLWVLPLSLYLLSFILCFERDGWYLRPLFAGLVLPALAGVVWVLYLGAEASLATQLAVHSAGLFVFCMVCHGELARLRPDPGHLTHFYLMVAGGGALGGVFVALVAPALFNGFFELHVGLVALGVFVLMAWMVDDGLALNQPRFQPFYLPIIGVFLVLAAALGRHAFVSVDDYETVDRNFYGVLRTSRSWNPNHGGGEDFRILYHGRIVHGFQYLGVAGSRRPMSYFGPHSGIGLAAGLLRRDGGLRIGVVGLGVGTMAAYAGEGDVIRFYEINPVVESLATTLFLYLKETPARWEIVQGDGRLSLERELREAGGVGRDYDLLVLDAFSGDAPPTHLLTREAFAVYMSHLAENGVVAVNVTNRHID
ncbi:MAG TPA: hypothetical protein VJ997_10670, partial [Longimicrobiales bacterium]|nr:hypothetical protein [Longimicrobiales bacterium]